MKDIILINCKNEPIYQQSNLEKNYNIIKFEAIPYQSWMCDFYNKKTNTLHNLLMPQQDGIKHSNNYVNTIKAISNNMTKNEISLLHNWRLMLEQNMHLPDDTIFGESDLHQTAQFDYNSIPWDQDYDIYRPYLFLDWTSKPMSQEEEKPIWSDLKKIIQDLAHLPDNWVTQKYKYGTHALIIPKNKRHKVIKAFSEYKQPSDNVLLNCVKANELKMAVLNYNAFSQWPHRSSVSYFNRGDSYKST